MTCSWPAPPHPRPLIKLHIIWKKDGVPLSSGISDYSRRLTILNPALADSGYYECEAVLRSSSVPAVAEGAYLSVLGEALAVGSPKLMRAMSWGGLSPRAEVGSNGWESPGAVWWWVWRTLALTNTHLRVSLCRAAAVRQGAGAAHHGRDGEGGGHPLPSQR